MRPIVLLDTCIIRNDVYLRRPQLAAVLRGAAQGDFLVRVPEVVVAELVKQYPGRIKRATKAVNKVLGEQAPELRRLGLMAPDAMDIDHAALAAQYEQQLRARLAEPGCAVEATPADLSEVADWAVNRRKPFKESGEGMPDAVIWATALQLAADSAVLLVTDNTKDFGDGEDPRGLHSDLLADLQHRNLNRGRIRLIVGLEALLADVVQPLARADARAERLLQGPETASRVEAALERALDWHPVPAHALDLGVDLEVDPQIASYEVGAPDLLEARELPDGRLLLDLRVNAAVTVQVAVFKADFYAAEEDACLSVTDWDLNEHYLEAEGHVDLTLDVELACDLDAENVEVEIADVHLSDRERLARRIRTTLGADLLDVLRGSSILVENYSPPEPLESDIETAEATNLHDVRPWIVDLESLGADGVALTLRADVDADVAWSVTAPTGRDVDEFASLAHGVEDGGGYLFDTAGNEPLELVVTARLAPNDTWHDIEVIQARLREREAQRRRDAVDARDPELNALIEAAERADR